jgi:hypothetical protein
LQTLQVEMFHHVEGTTHLGILVCGRHPFLLHTLNPPVSCFILLVAVTIIHSDLMDAARMENKKGLEDRSGVDT